MATCLKPVAKLRKFKLIGTMHLICDEQEACLTLQEHDDDDASNTLCA